MKLNCDCHQSELHTSICSSTKVLQVLLNRQRGEESICKGVIVIGRDKGSVCRAVNLIGPEAGGGSYFLAAWLLISSCSSSLSCWACLFTLSAAASSYTPPKRKWLGSPAQGEGEGQQEAPSQALPPGQCSVE